MLVDSHAHLDDARFEIDRENIIANFEKDSLLYVLHPAYDLESSIRAVNTSERYEKIFAAVGIHPHDVKDMTDDTIQILKSLTNKKKVLAIGEIGLDYYYDNSPRDLQKKWFREQVKLARELDMPYIIHDRDAHGDVLKIVKEEKYDGTRGIMHCFSGSVELAREYIKLGFLISIAGPVTFNNSKKTKEVVKEIPLEYLLIETDSPYLTPMPYRGKRNQPSYVKFVAEEIAKIKEISYEEAATATTNNFIKFFGIQVN